MRSDLRRQSLYNVLDDVTRKALRERCKVLDLAAGETVFMQDAPHQYSYIIEKGLVRTYYLAVSGKEVTLGHWSEGDLVGGPLVFGGGIHVWSGVTTKHSTLLAISGDSFREFAEQNKELYPWIVDVMSFKMLWMSMLLQVHGAEQVEHRLVKLLLMLGDIYGSTEDQTIEIHQHISQGNLASLIGASRQWTNKTVNDLKQRQLIASKNNHIVLTDIEGLKSIVKGR